MEKNLLSKLVRVANRLDSLGLLKEADFVDRIAQVNTSTDTQPDTENTQEESVATEDQDDTTLANKKIQEIKKLLNERKFQEAHILKIDIYRKIKDSAKKEAFLSQANQIYNIYSNKQNNIQSLTNERINSLITKYKINSATNLPEFKRLWTNMINDLKLKKIFTEENQIILRQTYFNIAAKFGVNRFLQNSTGNYKKDIENYKYLLTSGLEDEAEKFLNEAKNKYRGTQLDLFLLQAESLKNRNIVTDRGKADYAIHSTFLNRIIRFYGVDKAQNREQLDMAWGNLIQYFQKNKFDIDLKNPKAPFIYDYPKVKNQLDNLKKRLDIKFQGIKYD